MADLYWHGRRVFITGHTGFIGSWLSCWLTHLGAEVAGYSLPPHTEPALYPLLHLDDKMASHYADICDRGQLAKALRDHQPSVVLHLAGQAIVGRGHAEPYETWRVNALGTVALMETLRDLASLETLIVYTTDKVYENTKAHAYAETDPIGGLGLYDSSKAAAELAVRSFIHSGLKAGIATIRAGNVFGGGDWNEARLVPDCMRAFAENQPVQLRHPESIRPWQHVLDVCHATLMLTQALHANPAQFTGAWNVGPDAAASLTARELAESLGKYWGQKQSWTPVPNAPVYPEAQTLMLDPGKLQRALGWELLLPMPEALQWTAEWYKRYYQKQGASMAEMTLKQILAFEKKSRDLQSPIFAAMGTA